MGGLCRPTAETFDSPDENESNHSYLSLTLATGAHRIVNTEDRQTAHPDLRAYEIGP